MPNRRGKPYAGGNSSGVLASSIRSLSDAEATGGERTWRSHRCKHAPRKNTASNRFPVRNPTNSPTSGNQSGENLQWSQCLRKPFMTRIEDDHQWKQPSPRERRGRESGGPHGGDDSWIAIPAMKIKPNVPRQPIAFDEQHRRHGNENRWPPLPKDRAAAARPARVRGSPDCGVGSHGDVSCGEGTQYSVPSTQYQMLSAQYSVLGTGYSVLEV